EGRIIFENDDANFAAQDYLHALGLALDWGLVSADAAGEVTVHMDGGTVTVAVDRDTSTAVLSGPSVAIATIEIAGR
ncbi:MAG: hypothetical protein ACPGT2_10195, partial [Ilumatobacteraceae bacterium]